MKIAIVGIVSAFLIFASCGKKTDGDGNEIPEGMTRVTGKMMMGSQCPLGTISEPQPVAVGLWDCPGVSQLELVRPPNTLLLQADCRKKLLSVRTADRVLDSSWEVMPDGQFNLNLEAGSVQLGGWGSESDNVSGCTSFLKADIFGRVDCTDKDKAIIMVEINWWLGKGKKSNGFNGPICSTPASCYLHAATNMKQCS